MLPGWRMSRAIDSIHLKNLNITFIFNQNLPLSPPPSSHCRVQLSNHRLIIAILHLLLVVVVVVVVVVFSFNKRNSNRKRKLCTMIEYVNPACNVMFDYNLHVIKVPFRRGWVKGRGFAKSTWKSLDFTDILWSTHLSSAPYLSFRSSCH